MPLRRISLRWKRKSLVWPRKMLARLALLPLILNVVIFSCFFVNLYKLTQCDFESPYKCEVVHAIGLFPPASLIVAWFETDN